MVFFLNKDGSDKMIKTVMFDLDGTLLPMNQEAFIKAYFGSLAKKMATKGLDPQKLISAVGKGTMAMVNNDGNCTNEECFWKVFDAMMELDHTLIEEDFNDFYKNEFKQAKEACGYNPASQKLVRFFKEKGYRLICATNPLFPPIATRQRIEWAGIDPSDFDWITTYDNSSFCKPNLNYYKEILERFKLNSEEVLMIGNDVDEDLVVQQLNMKAYLVTDDLLNRHNKEYHADYIGSMEELVEFVKKD